MNNYQEICNKVIDIAKNAGKIIKDNITSSIRIETKGFNDFVTEIDKRCEQQIVNSLSELIPEAGFIVEEGTKSDTDNDYKWIVDPLDGTTNFIHGFFPCAVSIALEYKKEIVVGVIYEVGLDECFYASKENGAYLNGNPIQVSDREELRNSLLATGFPYSEFSPLNKYIKLLKHFTKNTEGIRRLGSAATDMAYVACGRFDGFYEYDLKPWDVAAGSIIVSEAGGNNCDFSGKDNYIYGKEIISSNSNIFKEFSIVVEKFMAD
jgi:myo-inositol-1(or 4)-monophosphatase